MPKNKLQPTHFPNLSLDSDSEGRKVSEMLDGSTGGLAEPKIDSASQNVKSQEQETKVEIHGSDTVLTISKSNKKNGRKHRRKASKAATICLAQAQPADNASPVTLEPPMEEDVPRKDVDETSPAEQSTKSIIPTQASESQGTAKKSSRKNKKAKNNANKAASVIDIAEPDTTQPNAIATQVMLPLQTSSPADETETMAKTQAQKTKKPKKKSVKHATSVNVVEGSKLSDNVNKTTEPQTHAHASSQIHPKSLLRANQNIQRQKLSEHHSRQKSLDLRVKVNGAQRDLTLLETPAPEPNTRLRQIDTEPVKIKLPGQAERLVWSEEPMGARHSGHSTSASSYRSESSIRGGYDMHSRQSSHTTVATSGALESKLQNMILSNTQRSKESSPTPTPFPDSSHNAAVPQSRNTTDQVVIGKENNPHVSEYHPHSPPGVQIPAVPTLYDSRPSQMQAPPSLGPALPQNLPEQIPDSHSTFTPSNQLYHNPSLAPQYPAVPYNNYYMQQQYYNQYPQAAAPLMSPYYDPMPYGSGTVYYSPDGTPVQYYPQQFYNPYHPQHYEY